MHTKLSSDELGVSQPLIEVARLRIEEVRIKFAENPPPKGTEMSAFRAEVSDFPPEWQGLMLGLMEKGYQIGADVKASERLNFIRETILCGVGVLLAVVGTSLTFVRDHMTPEQSTASCALIAAGLAAFLVFLPGFLKLQGVMKQNDAFESLQFKAGGAAAIFILTFVLLKFAFKI